MPRPRAAVAALLALALAASAVALALGGRGPAEVEAHSPAGRGAPAESAHGPVAAFVVLDDEFLGEQWGLFNWGQRLGGVLGGRADADVRAPEAWAITRGSRDVVVAIIDTGIDFQHPDLAENAWLNPGEMGDGRESNGIDDDGNGYVDDWRGWDFLDDDNDPRDELSSVLGSGSIGHGTAVASVAGAVGGNGIGISGVAPRVSLMALRVAGAGSVSDRATADAIDYAARMGARVVNISIVSGIPGWPNTLVDRAIARHPEVLFVVSAGNQGSDVDVLHLEPCSQSHANILCVGASDADDALAAWWDARGGSNWGATTVDLVAPGVGIAVAVPALETVFEDRFEGPLDPAAWSTRGGWGVEDGRLADSPGGAHSAGEETWVQFAQPVDLTGRQGCWLIAGGVTASTGGATTMFTETSPDGSRWTLRAGQAGFTLADSGAEPREYAMPLTHEQGRPFYLRLRLRPLLGPGQEARDGVSIDSLRVECLAERAEGDSTEAAVRLSDPQGAYGFAQGTSFAAPHVAGAAALVVAAFPELDAQEVKAALLQGAERLEDLEGRVASGARLDAHGALLAAGRLAPRVGREGADAPPPRPSARAEADLPGNAQPAGALMDITWGLAGKAPAARVDTGRVEHGGASGVAYRERPSRAASSGLSGPGEASLSPPVDGAQRGRLPAASAAMAAVIAVLSVASLPAVVARGTRSRDAGSR